MKTGTHSLNVADVLLSTVAAFAWTSVAIPAFAASIPVTNADMESDGVSTLTGWTTNGTVSYPLTSGWTSNYAFTRYNGSYIEQELGVAIDDSKVYSLKTDEIDTPGWAGGYLVEFVAKDGGGSKTVIGSSAGITSGGTTRVAGVQVSGAQLSPYVGQELVIRLGGRNNTYQNAGFDNVAVTENAAPTSFGAPTAISVPDYSFEHMGISSGWANYSGGPWLGGGFVDTNSGSPGYSLDIAAQDQDAAMGGNVYQTLTDTFVEGARYTMTAHYYSRDPGWTASMSLFTDDGAGGIEYINGVPVEENWSGSQWDEISITYVATAADAGKMIGLRVEGNYFDNVSLTLELAQSNAASTAPEPSTLVLAVLGLLGLAVRRNRRKRN